MFEGGWSTYRVRCARTVLGGKIAALWFWQTWSASHSQTTWQLLKCSVHGNNAARSRPVRRVPTSATQESSLSGTAGSGCFKAPKSNSCGCTFKTATLRARPVSRVRLMLSACVVRFLGFLGGLVLPELEAVDLKRDSPRTMVEESSAGRSRVVGAACGLICGPEARGAPGGCR